MAESSFEKIVQTSKLHPLGKFTQERWDAAFQASKDTSDRADHLYRMGGWIFRQLDEARKALAESQADQIAPRLRLRFLAATLNMTSLSISERAKKKSNEFHKKRGVVPYDALASTRYEMQGALDSFLPDELLTNAVDCASFVIDDALKQEADGPRVPKLPLADRNVMERITTAIMIENLLLPRYPRSVQATRRALISV
jgi:hypothetical protein